MLSRRQFLKSTAGAAVAAACPALPSAAPPITGFDLASGPDTTVVIQFDAVAYEAAMRLSERLGCAVVEVTGINDPLLGRDPR